MKRRKLKRPSAVWRNWLTPEDCFARFKNRLIIKLRQVYASIKNQANLDDDFALRSGHPVLDTPFILELEDPFTPAFDKSRVKQALEKASNLSEVCFVIECFLNSVQKSSSRSVAAIERAIREAVTLSPGIAIDVSVHGKEISFRPEGESFLDKGVVDEVLVSLEKHPAVSKHFKEALRIYASGEALRYRNALDNLRFALEALLKKALGNSKSLENQKPALLPWLRERGVHQQVVNMYEGLLFGPYSTYQNQAVKHNEEFSLVELEFIIYLTGTFMRLILVLSREKT